MFNVLFFVVPSSDVEWQIRLEAGAPPTSHFAFGVHQAQKLACI